MKLTINYKTRAGKVLNFSIEEVEQYAKRMKGHLSKCGATHVTPNMLIQAIFIIKDIQDKQLEQEAKELQVQNPIIRKYQHDIQSLSNAGLGCTRISKELYTKYKAYVSASTIYRYLKSKDHE